jgi:hypothetical protein
MLSSPVHGRAYSVLKIAKGAGIHTTRRHLTKKLSGSIGNTTLHSLPGLYLLASSNAASMLSASNATLNLAALLLTSIEIFIICCFFRIDPIRSSVWLSVKQVHLPDGYPFVGHVAIFWAEHRELTSEKPNKAKFVFVTLFVTIRRRSRCRIRSEKDPDWHPPITI